LVEQNPDTGSETVRTEPHLEEVIAAARALSPEARARLRKAPDEAPGEEDGPLVSALTGEADPVLADLWNNEHDAVYDSL
jgi:hypothetical protein